MQLDDFYFELPPQLIARYPLPERTASRLFCLNKQTGQISHRQFHQILDLLSPADLLVFNDTKVIPARLFGVKSSGGKVEVLVERILDTHRALAHVRASKSPKPGSILILQNRIEVKILARRDELFELAFLDQQSVLELLEQYGHVPLPSYLERDDEAFDKARYQTVYAVHQGAVAAPTAGLHFDQRLLEAITQRGIETAFLTLHVGAGTFQPVREKNITQHRMHAEYLEVNASICERIRAAKIRGGRIIAVGTTTVRALETAAQTGEIAPYQGDTRIFIYPGFTFRCVDAMITNFHLPKSSLLMLVCAFGGYERMMSAYQQAIQENYLFYSYGDAMWIGYAI